MYCNAGLGQSLIAEASFARAPSRLSFDPLSAIERVTQNCPPEKKTTKPLSLPHVHGTRSSHKRNL
ncbi:hypothetical protein K0M31_003362 [Melipona bicolor]|uniref:Uncharacterized protein n=1 Tax=Melipona bicolor TaxID=60889 RepID=A0AA40KPE1_9HYME|nr:hypothetical protein K0M31_003362 [Melipona bicolor]